MFKQYQNKSSLRKQNTRINRGGVADVIGDKIGWWEKQTIPYGRPDDITVEITSKYKNRPDLLAYDNYGSTELEWVILQYNNIIDINELVVGQFIRIPSKSRAMSIAASRKNTPRVF